MLFLDDAGGQRLRGIAVEYWNDGLLDDRAGVWKPSSTKCTVQPENLTPCATA